MCTNGVAPFWHRRFALTRALRPVDEFKKKNYKDDNSSDNNKSIRSDKNLPGYFAPRGALSNGANGMKLGDLVEPDVIKLAKWHFNRANSSGFTRGPFFA